MQIDTCKNLIIGTGEAGKWLAWTLGKQGQKCIAVERGLLGGACPNVACLPSKTSLIAQIVSLASRSRRSWHKHDAERNEHGRRLRGKRAMVAGTTRRMWITSPPVEPRWCMAKLSSSSH